MQPALRVARHHDFERPAVEREHEGLFRLHLGRAPRELPYATALVAGPRATSKTVVGVREATAVGVWLAWLKRRERAEDRALTVRAEIQSAVNRALEGESLLAVQVEPASSFHPGRVVLSTPMGYEWLVHEAWNPVIEHAPKEYEVVLRHAA